MIDGMQHIDDDTDRVRAARRLFPELAARLDAALERNRADDEAVRGRPDGDGRRDAGPRLDEMDRWLDAEASRLRSGQLQSAAFVEVEDPEARRRMEESFATAGAVASWSGVALPEPEAFAAAGVDLARLGEALAGNADLTAVPAPYGLGREAWLDLFGAAARRFDAVLTGAHGLVFSTEVEREFALLDRVPEESLPRVGGAADRDGAQRPVWTLRLVPAGQAPPLLGLGFAHGPHVSLPELLMLQLMRLVGGHDDLVDTSSFTWIAGVLGEGRLAARHVFDESEGVVRISCRGVFNQGPHMGARPPVA